MNKRISYSWRAALAKLVVAVMMIAVVAFVPTYTALAAKAPAISSKSVNMLVKDTYDLNIKNEIKGASYVWSSNNEKVATVDTKGIIKGKARGNAVITCKITSGKSVYTVTSKVKVIAGAKEFAISNKVAVLNKGQVYDVNRTIAPFTSNDVTTWTSSDTSIAKPDKNGKFTALKTGTVTITGKTFSGKSDSMTVKIIDADGVVATQAAMEELLKTGATKVTLRTEEKITFTIPEGTYDKTTLVVDAPKADIYNYGVFKAIDIFRVAPSTFHENAKGNKLVIRSQSASIEVAENASVSIEITAQGAQVTIKNDNGEITGVVMMSAADLTISGDSKKPIPVTVSVAGASITTSTPLAVTANAPAALTLNKGAEASTIAADKKTNIPTIYGKVTISVVVGTGATQEKVEVKGDESKTQEPAAPSVPGAGGGAPGGGTSVPTPDVTKVTYEGGRTQYILVKPVSQISTIKIEYSGFTYNVDAEMMAKLMGFLNDPDGSINKWKTMGEVTRTYGATGQVQIKASAATNGGTTRTITFLKSPLSILNNDYTAVLGTTSGNNGSFKLTSQQSGKEFTVTKVNDYTLEINSNIAGLEFTPVFK